MIKWTQGILKKVPLPFYLMSPKGAEMPQKLNDLINNAFRRIHGEKSSISTKERKEWAAFLHARGIFWEVRVRNKPNWEGWVAVPTDGYHMCRPGCVEDHIKVGHYFVPKDLAIKILALGILL